MEARLTELEVKLGFAEDLLDALNRTVYRQQQQIDKVTLFHGWVQVSRAPSRRSRCSFRSSPPA